MGAEFSLMDRRMGGKWSYKEIKFMNHVSKIWDQMTEGFTFETILENPDCVKKFYSYRPTAKIPEIKPLVIRNVTPFALEILPDGVDYYQPYWITKKGDMPKVQYMVKEAIGGNIRIMTRVEK